MPTLNDLIRTAREHGASDVHLEAGLPAALRISSDLRTAGEPLSSDALNAMAHEVIDTDAWPQFLERGSFDLSASSKASAAALTSFTPRAASASRFAFSLRIRSPSKN